MSDFSEPQHFGIISQCYDETFNGYYEHDIKSLGQGGQGDISLAKTRASGKLVVIKRLRLPPIADLKTVPELVLLDKVQKLGAHPNILPYLQIWTTLAAPGECPTARIILPYLPGGDLNGLKKSFQKMNVKMPEAFIFHAYKQLVAGFGFLHENGISHRDIKPENIMIDPVNFGDPALFGTCKVIDFGIAAETTADHETFDGTPKWMGPDAPIAGARADVWAMGAVIHFLATGCATKIERPTDIPIEQATEYYRSAPIRIQRLVNENEHKFAFGSLSHGEAQELTFNSGKPLPRDGYSPLLEYWTARALDSNPSTRITCSGLSANMFDDADRQIDFYKAWFRHCKAEGSQRPLLTFAMAEPYTNWTPAE
ncbi:kinase-like protein [Aureobasidium sp. EXF-12298]|nr:kinase-like protein [Aureobasidium sp. EXF-12298]